MVVGAGNKLGCGVAVTTVMLGTGREIAPVVVTGKFMVGTGGWRGTVLF